MRSVEFAHGAYTIKTIQRDGEYRARAFQNGSWLRDVSDWTGASIEDVVRRMRASLDELESDDEEEMVDPAHLAAPPTAPFLR